VTWTVSLTELSWSWIAVAAVAPLVAGLVVAWPIWSSGQPILGNIAGSILIFGAAIALIMREHTDLDRVVQACIEQGTTCWPTPSAFTRFAVFAFIGLAQVIALFTISISVETKQRRRGYAPEWR
jgi:hypothetical protein